MRNWIFGQKRTENYWIGNVSSVDMGLEVPRSTVRSRRRSGWQSPASPAETALAPTPPRSSSALVAPRSLAREHAELRPAPLSRRGCLAVLSDLQRFTRCFQRNGQTGPRWLDPAPHTHREAYERRQSWEPFRGAGVLPA